MAEKLLGYLFALVAFYSFFLICYRKLLALLWGWLSDRRHVQEHIF